MVRSSEHRSDAREAGFAFLWTLLLVAFLALATTVGVEIESTVAQREKERELLSIGRQMRAAIGRYYETRLPAGRREYPASLEDLLDDRRGSGTTRHLRRIFVDPMTGSAEWGLVRFGGRIVGVHSLSERMPIKQAGFEPDELQFRNRTRLSEWVFTYAGRSQQSPASRPVPGPVADAMPMRLDAKSE